MTPDGPIIIPEDLKTAFLEAGDLVFQDGTRVTAGEIWRFMTQEAPALYPYAYDPDPKFFSITRLSPDVENFSSIRRVYMYLTMRDRVLKASRNGKPLVYIGMGQTLEQYHAAGVIPLRHPVYLAMVQDSRGMTSSKFADDRMKLNKEGEKRFPEGCVSVGSYQSLLQKDLPIALVAPYLCTRCSDLAYMAAELCRSERKLPTYFVDFPLNQDRDTERAVDYVAQNMCRLTGKLGSLTGREITDEELQAEIRRENEGRKYLRDYMNLWWSAKEPPTNSYDHITMPYFTKDFLPDPIVVTQVLKETYETVKYRVDHHIRGTGVDDNPARRVICGPGSIAIPAFLIDQLGGLLAARDEYWSETQIHVKETGDPYENLARSFITLPFEQPTEKRAEYVVDLVRKSRADGLLFNYGWGCSYQSSAARMVCDIVKNETGIATAVLNLGSGMPDAMEGMFIRIEAFLEVLRGNRPYRSKVSLKSDPILEIGR